MRAYSGIGVLFRGVLLRVITHAVVVPLHSKA